MFAPYKLKREPFEEWLKSCPIFTETAPASYALIDPRVLILEVQLVDNEASYAVSFRGIPGRDSASRLELKFARVSGDCLSAPSGQILIPQHEVFYDARPTPGGRERKPDLFLCGPDQGIAESDLVILRSVFRLILSEVTNRLELAQ